MPLWLGTETMRKRSENFELVLLVFAIGIMGLGQLIWGNLFYGAIKAWVEKNVGVLEADLIAGLQQVLVPMLATIALIWGLYRYLRREAPLPVEEPVSAIGSLAEVEFGRVEAKQVTLDPGTNYGGTQQYFQLWCPIRFKRRVVSLTVRVSVLRPLAPLDSLSPQYVWKAIDNQTFFAGDTANIIFATVARNRQHNGFYGDMRKDAFYIGRISRHLFELDFLIGSQRFTKKIYLESPPDQLYSDAPRGFGQFGNLFYVLEEDENIFDSEWVRLSRDAVAGNVSLPIGPAPTHRGGFLGF